MEEGEAEEVEEDAAPSSIAVEHEKQEAQVVEKPQAAPTKQ